MKAEALQLRRRDGMLIWTLAVGASLLLGGASAQAQHRPRRRHPDAHSPVARPQDPPAERPSAGSTVGPTPPSPPTVDPAAGAVQSPATGPSPGAPVVPEVIAPPAPTEAPVVPMAAAQRAPVPPPTCRQVCMPGELRDPLGCCRTPDGQLAGDQPAGSTATPAALDTPTAPDAAVGCGQGRTRTPQTAGHCCYAGQVWADDRCRGIPSACPSGYAPDARGETCQLSECAGGRTRANDGVSCCWAGQAAVGGACRGVPSACPAGATIQGEACAVPVGRTLRFEVQDHEQQFEVELQTPRGPLRCDAPVAYLHDCTLRGVPEGPARVSVRGAGTFTRDITVPAGNAVVRIQHSGGWRVTVGWSLILSAAALGITTGVYVATSPEECNPRTGCELSGVATLVLALAIPAFIAQVMGGTILLRKGADDAAEVRPEDRLSSARSRWHGPRLQYLNAHPLAGGGAVGIGFTF